jgi:alcohol dehydrogenase
MTFRTAQVSSAGAPFTIADRELLAPPAHQVRVEVHACGICHTDSDFVAGHYPGLQFPLTPGHEIAGRIDAVGDGVHPWRVGDRVAIGWTGGYCGWCPACRRGEFVHCSNGLITGASFPGGYAEYVTAPQTAIARIPDELDYVDAAPLACAGVTVFNSLRRSGARAGDVVAVLGIGGLGHLGVQFAAAMGFRTVAIARGSEKQPLSERLGAHHYIDSTDQDVAAELQALGGARVIQATAANADAINATIDGLGPYGELLAIAAIADPLRVSPMQLIPRSATIHGHPGGVSQDVEDTLNFAAFKGIRPITETLPLERADDGYQRMLANAARFRVVLTMNGG